MNSKGKIFSSYGLITIVVSLLFLHNFFSCERFEPERSIKVTTDSVTNVSYNSCSVYGTVIDISKKGIDQHGFCWSTSQNPTTSNRRTGLGSKGITGNFSDISMALAANTTYYIRAYAQNEMGSFYGEQKSFTTLSNTVSIVTTKAVSNITRNYAQCGGDVTSDGGLTVSARGVCWNTTGNPNIEDFKTTDGSGLGSFTSNITGLSDWTTYFVRAYARNSKGTSYGELVNFTTTGIVSDFDGNNYQTVKIGDQIWMAENLSSTHYTTGKSLVDGTGIGRNDDFTTEYYFAYDDIESNVSTYGRLYTWAAIMNSAETNDDNPSRVQGICPSGWHVPSDSEWKELEIYLGMSQGDADTEDFRGDGIGNILKSTEGWNSDGNGTNESGFNVLPAGTRTSTGKFKFMGENADFWTATEINDSSAWRRLLRWDNSGISRTSDHYKKSGRSVRCVKGIVTPTVITKSAIDIIETTATVGGNVTADGGSPVTDRGVYYGTSPDPETSGGIKLQVGSGIGDFTAYLTDLSKSTRYYVKAYATNSAGTAYGKLEEFSTLQIISTAPVTNSWATTATTGGENVNLYDYTATEKGVCWRTSENPTINDFKKVYDYGNSGEMSFSVEITGLEMGTMYYVRAYVITNAGTFYGQNVSFTTENIGTVLTAPISDISDNSAVSGGNVTSEGSGIVSSRGVCWNNNGNPTHKDAYTTDGSGLGEFVSTMNGLNEGTTYYVRAYALNELGYAYGDEISFTTSGSSGSQITDWDGNTYNTVQIGSQLWMAENLKTTHYANGTTIPLVESTTAWDALVTTDKAYCLYDNNATNGDTYGALYTWAAAMNGAGSSTANPSGIQGVCPNGWHLPSDDEWTVLTTYLGGEAIAGDKMKETGTTYWNSPNTGASNESGFTALPGGHRYSNGPYDFIRYYGSWWSATESNTNDAWYRRVGYDLSGVYITDYHKESGFSVRCVRD